MYWTDLMDKWLATGKASVKDIKRINIFQRLELAEFWGIECNVFDVTEKLIKSIILRRKSTNKIKWKLINLQKGLKNRWL